MGYTKACGAEPARLKKTEPLKKDERCEFPPIKLDVGLFCCVPYGLPVKRQLIAFLFILSIHGLTKKSYFLTIGK